MLHVLHHVLQHRVGHVADEQVMLRVAVRDQLRVAIRGISVHTLNFVLSVTTVKIRGISYPPPDSWF